MRSPNMPIIAPYRGRELAAVVLAIVPAKLWRPRPQLLFAGNFARRETACFDLATNGRQSNSIPTRELIERIGSLHVALLSRQLKNQVLSCKFQHGTILTFNTTSSSAHVKARRPLFLVDKSRKIPIESIPGRSRNPREGSGGATECGDRLSARQLPALYTSRHAASQLPEHLP
jgi:hypothetical protein